MRLHPASLLLPLLLAALLVAAPACGSGTSEGQSESSDTVASIDTAADDDAESGTTDSSPPAEDDDTATPSDVVGPEGEDTTNPAGDAATGSEPVENACANPEDLGIAEAVLDLMLEQCALPCLPSDDPGACLEECAELAGFTADCTTCFGLLGECVGATCGEPCTPETDTEPSCEQCIGEMCIPAFNECSGVPFLGGEPPGPEPAPEPGICTEGEDGALLALPENPALQCYTECGNEDDAVACMQTCMDASGFSDACSECGGEVVACVSEACPDCTPENLDACTTCNTTGPCAEAWSACFASPDLAPGPELGACQEGDDQALLDSPADPAGQCWAQCIADDDPGECMNTCMANAGFSDECANCTSELGTCITDNCSDPCSPEVQASDDGAACGECLFSACGAEWTACFAAPEPPPEQGACSNPEDSTLFEGEESDEAVNACIYGSCWDSDAPQSCAEGCYDDAGFSGDCANCMGLLIGCLASECHDACSPEAQAADEGDACGSCLFATCGSELSNCFGMVEPGPKPDPELQAGLCATDPQDITATSAPGDAMGYCLVITCGGWGGPTNCFADCLMSLGYTNTCANCATAFTICIDENCAAECSQEAQDADDGEACGVCMGPACGEQWYECFNGMDAIESSDGSCINPEDGAISGDAGDYGTWTCFAECLDAADVDTCAKDCMLALGYSEPCSDCTDDYVDCIVGNCGAECDPSVLEADGGAACTQCTQVTCVWEYWGCFWTNEEDTSEEPEPEDLSVCGGEEDTAIWSVDPWECWWSCVDDADTPGCMIECTAEQGLSPACSACYGTTSECLVSMCTEECTMEVFTSDEGENCLACALGMCPGEWLYCFGMSADE